MLRCYFNLKGKLNSGKEFELSSNGHAYRGLLIPDSSTTVQVKTCVSVINRKIVVTEEGGEVADVHFSWVESDKEYQKEITAYRLRNKLKKFPFNMDWPTEDPDGVPSESRS